jgi:putative transcriptional regulator
VRRNAKMPIIYKFDVLQALKNEGYNTNRIRKEKILAESTLQKLRQDEMVAISNIEVFCKLLKCQPGDILEYSEGKEEG